MLNDIRFTEKVNGIKLLNSLERAMHKLGWPYRRSHHFLSPELINFEFRLGGLPVYSAWIEPYINPAGMYDKITVCTQELSADEAYTNNVQRLIMAVNNGVYDFSEMSQAKSVSSS